MDSEGKTADGMHPCFIERIRALWLPPAELSEL